MSKLNMACRVCGDEGQVCCANDGCAGALVCDSNKTCQVCGGQNQPCCANDGCGKGLGCDSDQICRSTVGPTPPAPPSPSGDGKKATNWLLPAIIVAVIVAIGLLGMLFIMKKK